MLSVSKALAEKIGEYVQIAIDKKKEGVYAITSNYLDCDPCIMSSRPEKMLTREDWLKFIRKYKLSHKDIRAIKSTWSLGAPTFESKSPTAMMAFRDIEQVLLKRMRSVYAPEKGDLFPWVDLTPDNSRPHNFFIFGNTGAGKSTFLNKLLTNTNKEGKNFAFDRPIVVFSTNPDDPSLASARQLHKKRWLQINLDKINGPITLDMVDPGALVIVDDSINLPRSDPRRQVLFDLLNSIAVRGRHKVGKKGNSVRGIEFCAITHTASERDLHLVRNSSTSWVFFPSTSKQQAIHILKSRLHRTKKEISRLFDRCGNSRYCLFRLHHPSLIMSSNHIELL